MTGTDYRAGAHAVRSSDATHHRAATGAQGGKPAGARTAEETAAIRFFWGELLLVAAMSIAGNIVHAWINAPTGKHWVAAFVASFPPVALLAATHGVGLLVRAQNKARLAYWAVVALTAAIAGVAFRLSFDALRELSTQVGMSEHLAWLFPLIIDGAIGQATIALLVLARTDRTGGAEEVRTEPEPVRTDDPVRTVSVREVRTETYSRSAELTAQQPAGVIETGPRTALEPSAPDPWQRIAESVCGADPAGRRDTGKVAAILRLKFEENWSHARIAEHVELSKTAVTRTITAAREQYDVDAAVPARIERDRESREEEPATLTD
ncbi:DUF2637 domain-containing protein [Nocardia wallacei]|uniref:DUF2637 domain-containing protein n=1 Tax=Nocardia wallacei TaxID=480035 RepID=UPI0024558DBF|nr:DUF2637 domain-containing protein [Nocardia wallacei]